MTKQFKPTPSLRHELKKKRKSEVQSKLERQRANFEQNQNQAFSVYCYPPWLSLKIRPVRANLISYFIVTLKEPLTKQEIQIRMVKGFGDLEEHKETIEKAI